MTPAETLAHLRALTDPTPEQLREASDLALLATGWKQHELSRKPFVIGYEDPNGNLYIPGKQPHPCASLDDAARWMVPEGCFVDLTWTDETASADVGNAHNSLGTADVMTKNPALALTIAGLSATLEGGK